MAIAGLASGPWTPASAPNLVLWLKSDAGVLKPDSVTPATNNLDPVYIWLDQSGNHNNVTNGATFTKYPTNLTSQVNGFPAITFQTSASTDLAMTNNITVPGNTWWSFFGVIEWTVANTVQLVLCGNNPLGIPQFSIVGGTENWTLVGNGQNIHSTQGAQTGIFVYFSAVIDGANSIIRTNGIQIASGTMNTQFGWTNMIIGNIQGGAGVMRGEIAELFAYNAALDNTATLTNAEKYLKTKYGF